jgi:hydrogenase maturation protein HypF
LASFPLPGGERAQTEPRRALFGILWELGLPIPVSAKNWFRADESRTFSDMLRRGLNCPRSCSVGRLFDAVAALLGVRGVCHFEGQAAMELQTLASGASSRVGAYPLPLGDGVTSLDTLFEALTSDLRRGVDRAVLARRFHGALIDWGVDIALRQGLESVVLAGGCFQNRLLADTLHRRLTKAGFCVLRARALPTNDGQISAGQAWLAAQRSAATSN